MRAVGLQLLDAAEATPFAYRLDEERAKEQAIVDALTIGLIILLPTIGLIAVNPTLLGYMSLWAVAGAAAVFAATLSLGLFFLGRYTAGTSMPRSSEPATASNPQKSIAVLPFSDLSPNHDQESFSVGMAEEILNALAHIRGLKVVGRSSSFFYKGKNVSLKQIGSELGVANVRGV